MSDADQKYFVTAISMEILGELLGIPAGAEIEAIWSAPEERALFMRVKGAGFIVPPGGIIPRVEGVVRIEPAVMAPVVRWPALEGKT